jgi:hypothetical protein
MTRSGANPQHHFYASAALGLLTISIKMVLGALTGGLQSPAVADSDVESIEAGSIEVCQHWTEHEDDFYSL